MSLPERLLSGVALHSGVVTSVRLVREEGPLRLEAEGTSVPLSALVPERADHGVRVRLGSADAAPRIDLVEHLLAALAGLGIREGVRLVVEGGEVPLLDGGAAQFVEALRGLGVPEGGALGSVLKPFSAVINGSSYRFEPADQCAVRVHIAFDHPCIGAASAELLHDPDDFAVRIAPARTFGFRAEWEALRLAGRAHGADPRAVVVYEAGGVHPASLPTAEDEPARHKLLDLLGDLALFGGPFKGHLEASRPGHAKTHEALRLAFAAGALERAP